jgi:ComF family protein
MMGLRNAGSALYDAALALLFPRSCAVCGASVEARADGVACAACWQKTRICSGDQLACWKCGLGATGALTEGRREMVRCRRCDAEHFTAARACGAYEGALRASVLALKREEHVPERLARLLFETQRRAPLSSATRIVPVPLHAERLRERGFNQATLLGRALSELSGLPLDEWSVARTTHTARHRAGMDARARRESVEGAFEVRRPRLMNTERILLVDDVYTTGATASACALALKEAGAQEVFVLTLARPF